MQSIHVFPGIAKFAQFHLKIADVSRTPGVSSVIQIFFGSLLGKV